MDSQLSRALEHQGYSIKCYPLCTVACTPYQSETWRYSVAEDCVYMRCSDPPAADSPVFGGRDRPTELELWELG